MITDLRLQNFRSYIDESFELSSGVNIIVGPNASGKTNLLEAVLLLARGSSYRAKDATEFIRFDQPWARIDCHSELSGQRTIKITREPLTKTYEIDGKTFKRLTLQHSLPVVLFEPNHLTLLHGSPEKRRDYLDDLLEQTTPGFSTTRRQYKRALTQRNTLLKQQTNLAYTQVFPWDVRLSQLAGQIVQARNTLMKQINTDISKLYQQISQTKTNVITEYKSHWKPDGYESKLLHTLEANFTQDRQRGFTSAGPHRDDLLVIFDEHLASEAASRGEVRTALLALKIIELKIIEDARQKTPLLLLDDVFSELDGKRRHALTEQLASYQTFITTTDADLAVKHFTQKCNVIPLS